jgi:hypothetical protein
LCTCQGIGNFFKGENVPHSDYFFKIQNCRCHLEIRVIKKYILQYGFFGSIEFLSSGDEIQSTGAIKERTVSVPLFRLFAQVVMMTYSLFRSYSILGEPNNQGEVNPLERSDFFYISPVPIFALKIVVFR